MVTQQTGGVLAWTVIDTSQTLGLLTEGASGARMGRREQDELAALAGAMAALVRRKRRMGRFVLPGSLPSPQRKPKRIAAPPRRRPATEEPVTDDPVELVRSLGLRGPIALKRVQLLLGDCHRCPLGDRRTHLVFGAGNPEAEVMFVGEAPGAEEDRQGIPFVGAAGELLTRMLAAMGLDRRDVYIANILKCRPPNNRDPEPHEIRACLPFLLGQIEAIQPRILVTLGRVAAQTLLESQASLSELRGRFHDFRGTKLLATYHPAFLLRKPQFKRQAWRDLQMVMAEMDRLGLKRDRSKR